MLGSIRKQYLLLLFVPRMYIQYVKFMNFYLNDVDDVTSVLKAQIWSLFSQESSQSLL